MCSKTGLIVSLQGQNNSRVSIRLDVQKQHSEVTVKKWLVTAIPHCINFTVIACIIFSIEGLQAN